MRKNSTMQASLPSVLFIYFLLPVPLLNGCRIGTHSECITAKFVPGHNLAGEGFDIVTMKTTGATVIDVMSYTDLKTGNCTLCFNTMLQMTQKIPLSVLDWRMKIFCKRGVRSQLFDSSSAVIRETLKQTDVSWKVGIDVKNVAGFSIGGSHSHMAKFAMTHSSTDKYSYSSQEMMCKYYSFRIGSRPPLSRDFAESLNALPHDYTKNSSKFQHLISTYGTHYLRQVDLGGRVHSITALRTCGIAIDGLNVNEVKDCLSVEASATIKGVTVSPQTEFCKMKSKKLHQNQTFSGLFSDRETVITGGQGNEKDILFHPSDKDSYGKWIESLKRFPGVVSYRLSPLHTLIKGNPVARRNLGKAISDYINRNAINNGCSKTCKVGRRISCACKCGGHTRVDSNCCPNKPGLATLRVTILRGAGLWGDFTSKTDGYVKVFYGNQGDRTRVIMNNDFPQWNHVTDFGTVDLLLKHELRFEVWDKDTIWRDDHLGTCKFLPEMGSTEKKCALNHGFLVVSITTKCAPNLQGSLCQGYEPSPDSEVLSYVSP